MVCSITINRKAKPESEVKYVDVGEELKKARRAIIQHIAESELLKEIEEAKKADACAAEFEVDVEDCLRDLYEKVGILKERIEKLERRK